MENKGKKSRMELRVIGIVIAAIAAFAFLIAAMPADAVGTAQSGQFRPFSNAADQGINATGTTTIQRTSSGRTFVTVEVRGLNANTIYGSYVHIQPCTENEGGERYRHEANGPANEFNELWPGFQTDNNGNASSLAVNDWVARNETRSVVIASVDGARVACADLN